MQTHDAYEINGFAPFQVEYVLTPQERDQAAVWQIGLEDRRRRMNERDARDAAGMRVSA